MAYFVGFRDVCLYDIWPRTLLYVQETRIN